MKLSVGDDDRHVQALRGAQYCTDTLQVGGIERAYRALFSSASFRSIPETEAKKNGLVPKQ